MSFGIPVRNGLALGLTPSTTLASGRIGGRPALLLNFISTTALPSTITFSRGSNATLTDSTGKITYAPNNLLTNSESFEATAWTKFAGTVTSNTLVAPDGTTSADTFTANGVSTGHRMNQTAAAGFPRVFSVYLKAGTATFAQILFDTDVAPWANFDLSLGAVGSTGTNQTATITNAGNGWYRCAVYTSSATATSPNIAIVTSATAARGEINTSTGALNLWGAQLEAVTYQTTPGTYNSTTPKNLLGYTQEFDNAAWTKSNAFVQTNLLLQSEALGTSWTASSATVTSNSTIAPNGTTTADTLASTGVGGRLTQNVTAPTTGSYTASVYVQAGTVSTFELLLRNNNTATNIAQATFNLANGTVSATTAGTAAITNVGGGWYRVSVTSSGGVTAADLLITYLYAGSSSNASGNSVILWGAQLVQGATAGDYQPTYAAAAAVQYAAPNGTLSADALIEDTANAQHTVSQAPAVAASTTYTVSVYAKRAVGTRDVFIQVNTSGGTTGAGFASFNLGNGTASSITTLAGTFVGVSATATSVGGDWYRCSLTFTTNAGNTIATFYVSTFNAARVYTGNGTSGIYVWGAQLSNSASLDPYVYNPGAAPTSAAYYGPRFDYDPVTLAPKGLLIEEQRSNLLTYSEQFNGNWTTSRASISANTAASPDGTQTADAIVEDTTAANSHAIYRSATLTAAAHTLSVFVKANGRNWIYLVCTAGTNAGAYFNISNGTVGTVSSGYTASIVAYGNGWYRCSIAFTATAATWYPNIYLATGDNSTIYTGDGTSGVLVWGAQLEAGAFATSYIPTVASTVTRSADVAQMLGTNFSSWYNTNAGTFVFNGDSSTISGVNFILTASDGTSNNRFGFYRSGAILGGYVTTATVTQMDLTASSVVVNVPFKSAAAATLNDGNFSFNGGIGTTDTSISMPSLNQLGVGNANGSGFLNGHIRTLSYYNTRLTNTQLQALTA